MTETSPPVGTPVQYVMTINEGPRGLPAGVHAATVIGVQDEVGLTTVAVLHRTATEVKWRVRWASTQAAAKHDDAYWLPVPSPDTPGAGLAAPQRDESGEGYVEPVEKVSTTLPFSAQVWDALQAERDQTLQDGEDTRAALDAMTDDAERLGLYDEDEGWRCDAYEDAEKGGERWHYANDEEKANGMCQWFVQRPKPVRAVQYDGDKEAIEGFLGEDAERFWDFWDDHAPLPTGSWIVTTHEGNMVYLKEEFRAIYEPLSR